MEKIGKKKMSFRRYNNRKNRRSYNGLYSANKLKDSLILKAEAYTQIGYSTSGTQPVYSTGSANNLAVNVLLQSAESFAQEAGSYGRYKITGMSIRYDSVMTPNSAALLQNIYPIFYCAFYPQFVASDVGDNPLFNDKKFALSNTVTTPQVKYIKFPDNYFTASNGGYGTWNTTQTYTSLAGQFCIRSATPVTSSGTPTCGTIRFTFYIIMSSKNN